MFSDVFARPVFGTSIPIGRNGTMEGYDPRSIHRSGRRIPGSDIWMKTIIFKRMFEGINVVY